MFGFFCAKLLITLMKIIVKKFSGFKQIDYIYTIIKSKTNYDLHHHRPKFFYRSRVIP